MACLSSPCTVNQLCPWHAVNQIAEQNLKAALSKAKDYAQLQERTRIKEISIHSIQTIDAALQKNSLEPSPFNCLEGLKVRVKYYHHCDYTHDLHYTSTTSLTTGNKTSDNFSARSEQEIFEDLKKVMDQFLNNV